MEETDHGGERLRKIVNMVLESVEVHDGGLLYFHFLDGTVLEIEAEE